MLRLRSGESVTYRRKKSHIHPGVKLLLPEALARIDSLDRDFFVTEVDFGEVVGVTHCVTTKSDDKIIYARRQWRSGHSRFVTNREPEPCSVVTVILQKDDDSSYVLITAFVGYRAEPEPWDKRAGKSSRLFWDSHALIPEGGRIVLETATLECPWDKSLP